MENNENENKIVKSLGLTDSNSKRQVYSNIGLPQETRKISNKQPNLTPKESRKRKSKVQS